MNLLPNLVDKHLTLCPMLRQHILPRILQRNRYLIGNELQHIGISLSQTANSCALHIQHAQHLFFSGNRHRQLRPRFWQPFVGQPTRFTGHIRCQNSDVGRCGTPHQSFAQVNMMPIPAHGNARLPSTTCYGQLVCTFIEQVNMHVVVVKRLLGLLNNGRYHLLLIQNG